MLLFLFISIQLSHIASKPLEEAMEREKQFVADISHDLKTPLSVILANNSILMENKDATVGSVYRWIDSSQMAAKRMQQLITQMLKLADVERQNITVPLEEVDVSNIAMKASLQLESLAYEKSVTLLMMCSILQASASATLGSTPAAISFSVKKQWRS